MSKPLLTSTITNVHTFTDRHLISVPVYSDLQVTLSMNLLPGTSELYVIASTRGRQPGNSTIVDIIGINI